MLSSFAEALFRFSMLALMFSRFSPISPLTRSPISWRFFARPGVSFLSVSEKARRLEIVARRSSLFAEEISLSSAERTSTFTRIRFSRSSFAVTTARSTSVVSWTFRRMSDIAFRPSSVPKVMERVSVNFFRSSEISETFRMISSRCAGGIVFATRPPSGRNCSAFRPGRISTYFSPRSPWVWIEAMESTGMRTPSWIRSTRRARFSTSRISSSFPTGTPAILTFAFGSRPAAVSKSTVSLYPCSPIPPHLLTRKVKWVRTTSPSRTKIPTFASFDIIPLLAPPRRPSGGRTG